jgi:hypothetical protein
VNNPIYATGVGLILYGFKYSTDRKRRYQRSGGFTKLLNPKILLGRMRKWFKDNF